MPVEININQAIPCSLIINEMATNILKHAYDKGDSGTISAGLQQSDGLQIVRMEDDGKGLPKNFEPAFKNTKIVELIDTLAMQLKVDYHYERLKQGARFTLSFEKSDIKGSGSSYIKQ